MNMRDMTKYYILKTDRIIKMCQSSESARNFKRFFYTTIGVISLLHSGMCFRCYVCNSIDDMNCETQPRLVAQCKFLATGCIKLINHVTLYRFIDATGKEITAKEWDGVDTTWKAVPYEKRVISRRCGNNYARYQAAIGCNQTPFANTKRSKKEMICYCESQLCNGAVRSLSKESRNLWLVTFMIPYIYIH